MNTLPPAAATDSRRRSLLILLAAALMALALVVFMVSSVTRAAWTDTTRNDTNSWATGEVTLTDDDGDSAMFTITNMMPGDTLSKTIIVTNESTVSLDVKLYGETLSDSAGLGEHLNLKIGTTSGGAEVYDGTAAGTLTGTDGFASTHTDYASGTAPITLGTNTGTDDTEEYFFWVELDSEAPDSVQGASASIDFVWEGHTQ